MDSLRTTDKAKKRPSVRSLAKATGLSVATISRVLNKSESVSDKTRTRVLSALQEHGYVMNSAARALATNRTRTIGAVVPTLSYSIFARFLNAVEQHLAELGYALVVATSGGDINVEAKRARELLDIGTEGLILSGAIHEPDLIAVMQERNIPFICTSISENASSVPAVGYDNIMLAEKAVRYLYGKGHRHICVVHGDSRTNDRTVLRLKGISHAVDELAINICMIESSLDVGGGVDAAKIFIKNNEQASACLCLSDVLALGMVFEFSRNHIKVPDDISVMGFDDLDWAEHCHPALTTIGLPTISMGEKTAQAMVRYLDYHEPIDTLSLDAAIIERETVKQI